MNNNMCHHVARKAIQKMEEVEQERVAARQSRIENVMKVGWSAWLVTVVRW